jgi:hypothetical protein
VPLTSRADYDNETGWLKLAAKWQRMAEEAGPAVLAQPMRKAEG